MYESLDVAMERATYMVAVLMVHDRKTLFDSARAAVPFLERFGGQVVAVSHPSLEILEGTWNPGLVVVQRWPNKEQARRFFESEEYRPLKALRQASATSGLILFDGERGRRVPAVQHPTIQSGDAGS